MNQQHAPEHAHRAGPSWSQINQWLLWLGLAAAVAWMFFRHNEHLVQLLPFLFILACPLMHLFGHGGRGHHGHHGHHDAPDREPGPRRAASEAAQAKQDGPGSACH